MKLIENYDVKIFTDNVENVALEQIMKLLSIDVFSGCKIRIMPDVHAGAGCVIGFTGDLGDKVIPNIVGVDIGCGILVQPFKCEKDIDFHEFNEYILKAIPIGRNFRGPEHLPLPEKYMPEYREAKQITRSLHCYRDLKNSKRIDKSIGSLGGGNHFIELNKDESGLLYLVVHTGSRNLGKQVADFYQQMAIKSLTKDGETLVPKALCFLQGEQKEKYLHDMKLCQRWAVLNRKLIMGLLMDFLQSNSYVSSVNNEDAFESVHNYISDENLIRKGAISAKLGEKCIIPMNMRDGSLICIGKGNEDWNNSAPHGAGRVMSRTKAFEIIELNDFKESMKGIYSETISEGTKDESPMVYKPMQEIVENISDTVTIINTIKPIFNFKAAE